MRIVQYTPEQFGALRQFVDRVGLHLSLAHRPFVDYYYAKQDWCRLYLNVAADGTILATYGLEALRFEYQNCEMAIGFGSNNYTIRPGAGLFLVVYTNDFCPTRLLFGGSVDAHKIVRALNWTYYQGVKIYVLNRTYETYSGDGWFRAAAKSLAQRVARSPLSRFASRLPSHVSEQILVREEQVFAEDLLPVSSPFNFRFAPSPQYLNWRYNTALSFVRYRIFRILNGSETAGYVIINEMPEKLIVAQCDGTDPRTLAYGVLQSVLHVGREDRAPRSVVLASCHPAMQAIYRRFGFRPEPQDRPFCIGALNKGVALEADTSNWLVNFDWGDNGLRPPFLDQREANEHAPERDFASPPKDAARLAEKTPAER